MRRYKVLFTGQVGLNKSKYLEEAKQKANELGWKLKFESIGQRMIKNYPGKIDENSILNLSKVLLDTLRQWAWKEILSELKNSQEENHEIFVINTHAVLRWHHGFFPALELELIREFSPDIVIVLIDDILQIKKGLQERGTDFFELWELFAWREEEIWLSKFIADTASKLLSKEVQFFVVPKSQGPDLLTRLVIEKDTPKVYTSFPITGISEEEKVKIETFKERVKEEFITFDPGSIEDRDLTVAYYTVEDEMRKGVEISLNSLENCSSPNENKWTIYKDDLTPLTLSKLKFDIDLLGRELLPVLKTIDSQIISRDYLLIDQIDFVIMYIRMDSEGKPLISAGCQSEMVYGYSHGKEVYIIFAGGKKKLSPWVTVFSKAFKNTDDAFKFIIEKHGKAG